MNIRISRLCTFTLISLVSLFGFAAQAGAQDNIFNQLSGSLELRGKTGNTHKAKTAGAPTYSYEVLYSFCPGGYPACTDGGYPVAGVIQDAAGNLYGTTAANAGTVFKLDSTGRQTVLYTFCSASGCTDGNSPQAGLIRDSAGDLYGTTFYGGANNFGVVFKVDNTGHETVLYSFCSVSGCTDGANPAAGVIQDAAGNLYGTTKTGGANDFGTVFKLDSTGHETVLYSFGSRGGDGGYPEAGLIQDGAGNLYGTTNRGGYGFGTVFKVDTSGHETVLYSFCSAACTDGAYPAAGVIQDAAGNLDGTTSSGGGGGGGGVGTVFKLDSTGHETVLYSFCSSANCTDGANPFAGVIQDAAGNLYGTTSNGGANNRGVVFKVDNTGNETVLYSFCSVSGCTDGRNPLAGVIQDAAGDLYGTTEYGGVNFNSGTVFKLATSSGGTATVALTSSPNPSYVDQSVTLSAVVSGTGATPTGSVTFKEGTTALGTATLANGQASLTTTFTKSGSVSIVASYSGDTNYNPANSSPLKQVVKQYATSTALTSSLNPSTYGQPVTLTATVSSVGPTPTGTVTFKNGSKSLGSATLSGGVAKITKSTLPAGTLTITATYNGDTANAKSTSPALTQVVNKATSTTAIVSSVNPSNVGQTVKFTATVTSPTTKPTGTVTFKDGSTVLGTVTLLSGKASYSTSTLSAGSHKITAVYGGTVNIVGSTSPILVQTVN
jgi:uncharacterized repeat protein (TIGR03803 family)